MTAAVQPLSAGVAAPDFTLRDQHGVQTTLAGFRGRDVLVVFYPFAFSRVCGAELRALREGWPRLAAPDRALLAISCDPVYALRAYSETDGLRFPLLSDFWPHGEVASRYGVLDLADGAAHRCTFLVDRSGTIAWSLNVPRHASRSISDYEQALQVSRKANSG